MREALGRRDVRLLLLLLGMAQTGDWLYGIALSVHMLSTTGAAGWVAAAGVVRLLPWVVLSAPAGVIADRVSRRTILILSSVAQAAVMVAMTGAAITGGSPALTLALAALAAAASVPARPALTAALPHSCDERHLAAVNAWCSAVLSAAMVLGPALGALLLILGNPVAAFAANAVGLLVAAGCAALVRMPLGPLAAERQTASDTGLGWRLARTTLGDLSTGARALASSASTALLVAVAAGILFAYTAQVVLWTVLADRRFGLGAEALTILYAAYGLGGVLSTIPASRAAAGRDLGRVLAGAIVVGGLSVVALARVTDLVPTILLVAIQGVVVTMADFLGITLLQRALGVSLLGRAIGALNSTTSIAMVAGSVVAPVLLGAGGLPVGFAVVGGALACIGILAAVTLRGPVPLAADTVDRVRRLARLPLFAGAPQYALEGLATASHEVRMPTGTVVMREGEPPDDVYILLHGAAAVSANGLARPVNILRPGDFFGEIGLLRRVPRTATVITTEPSTLLQIDGALFLELVGSGVAHGATLGRSVGRRLARTRIPPMEQAAAAPR